MRKDVKKIAEFGKRILNGGEALNSAEEEGYYGRGVRRQIWLEPPVTAADRVIDMLLKRFGGEKSFKQNYQYQHRIWYQ